MTPLNTRKSSSGDVVLESRHLIGLFMVMVVIFGVVFVLGYELGRNQYTQQVHASTPATDEPSSTSELVKSPSTASTSAGKQPSSDQRADADSAPAKDWDFYKSADSKTAPEHLEKPAKNAAASNSSSSPSVKISGPAQPLTANSPVKPSASSKSSAAVQPVANKPAPSVSNAPTKPAATNVAATKSAAPSKPQSMDAPLLPRGTILLQVAALVKQSDALAMAEVLEQKKFPTVIVPPGADKFYHVQVGPYRNLEAAISARNALENAGFKSIIKR
jgi:cell division protein FtsN